MLVGAVRQMGQPDPVSKTRMAHGWQAQTCPQGMKMAPFGWSRQTQHLVSLLPSASEAGSAAGTSLRRWASACARSCVSQSSAE